MGNKKSKDIEQQIIDDYLNAKDSATDKFRERMSEMIVSYLEQRTNYICSYRNVCDLLSIKPNFKITTLNLPEIDDYISRGKSNAFTPDLIQQCMQLIKGFVDDSITIRYVHDLIEDLKKQHKDKQNLAPPPYVA